MTKPCVGKAPPVIVEEPVVVPPNPAPEGYYDQLSETDSCCGCSGGGDGGGNTNVSVTPGLICATSPEGFIGWLETQDDGSLNFIDPFDGSVTEGVSISDYSPCVGASPADVPTKGLTPTGEYIGEGEFCGKPTMWCVVNGTVDTTRCFFYNKPDLLEVPVGTTVVPYQPTDAGTVCATAQIEVAQLAAGTADTVGNLATAQIAAETLQFDFNGTLVDVTADDLSFVSIVPKPCNGDDILEDWIVIDGNNLAAYTDDEEGGVGLDVPVEIPAAGCGLATMCFKKCLSKAELAALAK